MAFKPSELTKFDEVGWTADNEAIEETNVAEASWAVSEACREASTS